MAAIRKIAVPCPECGEEVDVAIDVVTFVYPDRPDALQVRMQPDVSLMAEHYAAEHAGADVSDHG